MQCNSTLALNAFLSNVSVGSDKIAVIGCGCSLATEAVAAISAFWNITHVSHVLHQLLQAPMVSKKLQK